MTEAGSLGADSPALDAGLPGPLASSYLEVPSAEETWSRWERFFLFATGALASTILLKFAAVQYLEYIYALHLFLLAVTFPRLGFQVRVRRAIFWLGIGWLVFSIAVMALAVASLRFDFYLPAYLDPIRYPVTISALRLTEYVLSFSVMLYLAHTFRRSAEKARFTLRVYFWTGVASAVYSMISYPLDVLGIASLGAYADLHRFRGFYNEGGPYGLYAISVLLAGIALYRLGWDKILWLRWGLGLMLVAFVMSQSKAAFLAAGALLLLNVLIGGSLAQRSWIIGAALVLGLLSSQFLNISGNIAVLEAGAAQFERLSHRRYGDANFVYGRVAGLYIVPRMIKAHPLTGIGLGNYGTLRNAPEYRGAAYYVENADDSGLGILGYVADLGIPLITYTLFLMFMPFFLLRRLRAPSYLTNLALLQPIVHIFGAQLNVTYSWVVTAFALGIGYNLKAWQTPPEQPQLAAPAEELERGVE